METNEEIGKYMKALELLDYRATGIVPGEILERMFAPSSTVLPEGTIRRTIVYLTPAMILDGLDWTEDQKGRVCRLFGVIVELGADAQTTMLALNEMDFWTGDEAYDPARDGEITLTEVLYNVWWATKSTRMGYPKETSERQDAETCDWLYQWIEHQIDYIEGIEGIEGPVDAL